ncbi:putative transposase, partial [Phenoliferia sp. Uapishka_3]
MDLWSGVIDLPLAAYDSKPSSSTKAKVNAVSNAKARNTLIFGVADSEFVHLETKSACECWNNLKDIYATPGKVTIAKAYQALFATKLKDGDDIVAHLTNQLQQSQRLSAMGEVVSDPVLVSSLLMSLPPSYQDLRLALENLPAGEFTSGNVSRRIRSEVATRPKFLAKTVKAESASLLAVNDNGDGGEARPPKSKAHIKCFECEDFGHYRGDPECPLTTGRGRRGNGGRGRGRGGGNVGARAVNADERAEVMAICIKAIAADDLATYAHPMVGARPWVADSGAVINVSGDRSILSNYVVSPLTITLADDSTRVCPGFSETTLHFKDGKTAVIKRVYYLAGAKVNLFSVRAIDKLGYEFTFGGGRGKILNPRREFVGSATSRGGSYILDLVSSPSPSPAPVAAIAPVKDAYLWHRRFAHGSLKNIRRLEAAGTPGLEIVGENPKGVCGTCEKGQIRRLPFPKAAVPARAERPLKLVSMDLGFTEANSFGGHSVFVLAIDSYSRMIWGAPLKTKKPEEVLTWWKKLEPRIERESGHVVDTIRSDNGPEFVTDLKEYHEAKGGRLETIVVPESAQNGGAERPMQTIVGKTRKIRIDAGRSKAYWAFFLLLAIYIYNITPHSAIGFKTPHSQWFGEEADVSHLRVPGCTTYDVVEDPRKLDDKGRQGVFVGYPSSQKGYTIFYPDTKECFVRRNITFAEEGVIGTSPRRLDSDDEEEPDAEQEVGDGADVREREEIDAGVPRRMLDGLDPDLIIPGGTHTRSGQIQDARRAVLAHGPTSAVAAPIELRQDPVIFHAIPHPLGSINIALAIPIGTPGVDGPTLDDDFEYSWADYVLAFTSGDDPDPQTEEEALASPEGPKWRIAIDDEYSSLRGRGVWIEDVVIPAGATVIDGRMIFKRKRNARGEVTRYKARFVARGFNMKPTRTTAAGETIPGDYSESFAPVARTGVLRTCLQIATSRNYELSTVDVKTAYLYGKLKETHLYMIIQGKPVQLVMGLYSLVQSGATWNSTAHAKLLEMGFVRSDADPCLYVKGTVDVNFAFILLYVDDLRIGCQTVGERDGIWEELAAFWEISGEKEATEYLGMSIERDRALRTLKLGQFTYCANLPTRFGLVGTAKTPATTDVLTSSPEDDLCDQREFQSIVGAIAFPTLCTRPDASFAVNNVAQFAANPKIRHLHAAQRIARYLGSTSDLGLVFGPGENIEVIADSEFATADPLTRRSVGAWVVRMGERGTATGWSTKRQTLVATSSTEAETYALAEAIREAIWQEKLLKDLQVKLDGPIVVREDNTATIQLATSVGSHGRTKHFDMRIKFIRNRIERGDVSITYIPTAANVADALTKPLGLSLLARFRAAVGIL